MFSACSVVLKRVGEGTRFHCAEYNTFVSVTRDSTDCHSGLCACVCVLPVYIYFIMCVCVCVCVCACVCARARGSYVHSLKNTYTLATSISDEDQTLSQHYCINGEICADRNSVHRLTSIPGRPQILHLLGYLPAICHVSQSSNPSSQTAPLKYVPNRILVAFDPTDCILSFQFPRRRENDLREVETFLC